MDKCFKGDLIHGRTVLLVVSAAPWRVWQSSVNPAYIVIQTHNVAIVSPVASYIVDLGSDGRARSYCSLDEALARDGQLADELARKEIESSEKGEVIDEEKDQTTARNGTLIADEEMAEGHIGWSICQSLLTRLGELQPSNTLLT